MVNPTYRKQVHLSAHKHTGKCATWLTESLGHTFLVGFSENLLYTPGIHFAIRPLMLVEQHINEVLCHLYRLLHMRKRKGHSINMYRRLQQICLFTVVYSLGVAGCSKMPNDVVFS